MQTIVFALLVVAMFATLAILIVGVWGFRYGGEFNKRYGNKLMRARVAMQAVCILLFLVLVISQ